MRAGGYGALMDPLPEMNRADVAVATIGELNAAIDEFGDDARVLLEDAAGERWDVILSGRPRADHEVAVLRPFPK